MNRIAWLSVLRGLNIALIVMFHVQLVDFSTGMNHPFCEMISSPFTPLRVPLFIFISGGLLYLSRIQKGWSVGRLYLDKAQRILIPFVFFVTFYYVFKLSLGAFVKTPIHASVTDYLESFVVFEGHASAPLWFLATLTVLMMLYPLFQWLCEKSWRMMVFFLLSGAFYFADFSSLVERNYFYLFKLNRYLVFFFVGIFFFKYQIHRYLDRIVVFLFLVMCYALSYWQDVPLLTPLLGILMMCSGCLLVARRLPGLFSSFSEYIFQIYLMSMIFQAFVELILWKRLFYNEALFPLFYILNVAAGIFLPVLVAKVMERCPWRWLRLCFGLK